MAQLKQVVQRLGEGEVFKICYLFLTLLSFNSLTAHRGFMFYGSVCVTLLGALLLLYRIFHYKGYQQTQNVGLLVLFCVAYLLSMLANRKYGVTENLQGLVWMAFQFFLLYTCDVTRPKNIYKKEFHHLSLIFVAYTGICALVSMLMLFSRYRNIRRVSGGARVISGFLWGRLWGAFADPNYGAVFAVVSMILCIYFLMQSRSIFAKLLLSLNIALQFLYSVFSDSRTGLVCLMIALPIYLSVVLYNSGWLKKYFLRVTLRCLVCLLFCFTAMAFCALSNTGVKQLYNIMITQNSTIGETLAEETIGRQEDVKSDPSNRRFDIWRSGTEIFWSRPFVGVTFRNLVPYARAEMPTTYIINNGYADFASLHNIFFDLLASQGILGVLIMAAFGMMTMFSLIRGISRLEKKEQMYLTTLLCTILTIAISSMFYSEILYINTGGAFLFWCFLGYVMHLLKTSPRRGTRKRAGILTFHRARNIGGCLQALALQVHLEKSGLSVEIVDYRPNYIEDSFGVFIMDIYRQARGSATALLLFFVKTAARLPFSCIREYRFRLFRKRFFNLSPIAVTSAAQLDCCGSYDLMIFGSDQIWNPVITKGFAGEFFGEFSKDSAVRASYAASIGLNNIDAYRKSFCQGLSCLDYISVRETTAKELVCELTEKEVAVVIDPTLLLSREDWCGMIGETSRTKKKYVLVYALEINDELIRSANQIAAEKDLMILFFDIKNRYSTSVIRKYTADPIAFLRLMRDAEYVVTNSFHGTVFSIIFEKQFLCIPHKQTASRATDLLGSLGLEVRLLYSAEEYAKIYEPIEYDCVKEQLLSLQKKSQAYLNRIYCQER